MVVVVRNAFAVHKSVSVSDRLCTGKGAAAKDTEASRLRPIMHSNILPINHVRAASSPFIFKYHLEILLVVLRKNVDNHKPVLIISLYEN